MTETKSQYAYERELRRLIMDLRKENEELKAELKEAQTIPEKQSVLFRIKEALK